MVPLVDRKGTPTGRVLTFRDTTDRKHAQAQLLQQQRTQAILEERERLEREIAELLHSRVQSRLLVAWHRLHPSIISLGLLPAIRSLVEEAPEAFHLTLDVDPTVTELDNPVDNRISQALRLAVYRVVEEGLNNVYRHSKASTVEVTMGADSEHRLTVSVRDDGRGFDVTGARWGLGLNSIAGRVEQAGGTWQVTSEVGQGTRLTALFPLVAAGSNLTDLRPSPSSEGQVLDTLDTKGVVITEDMAPMPFLAGMLIVYTTRVAPLIATLEEVGYPKYGKLAIPSRDIAE